MRKHLLWLYPRAWRDRYGEELSALLEQTPPGIAATLDLLRGALIAHLRPLAGAAPAARARGTIVTVLGCFIIFSALGSGFAKTTENYDYIEYLHPLLGVSHSVILIGALVGAGALLLAAAPLALASVALARRERDDALTLLVLTPPAAIATFAGSLGVLALWLNGHRAHPGVVGWLLLCVCALCAAGGAFACWAASRALVRRIDPPAVALAFSVAAVALVTLCMAVVTVATCVFLVGILVDAPQAGAAGNGPGQLVDVTTSIAVQLIGMLAVSAAAALSSVRGLRSLRAL